MCLTVAGIRAQMSVRLNCGAAILADAAGSEQHEKRMYEMRRREFITLVGGAAAAWPLAARAQQPTMPVIGVVSTGAPESAPYRMTAFRQGLNEAGYVEGQSVAIEYRWAEGRYELMPELVADLLRRRVAIIATPGSADAALAAKAATAAVPIVFADEEDPVKLGLVASLARPGGNVTGLAVLETELQGNRMRLLRELVPTVNSIAVLLNPVSRKLFRKQLAPSHKKYRSCRQAVNPRSVRPSRLRHKGDRRRLLLPPMRSLIAGASNWSRWRKATPFRQSIIIVSSSPLAVS